MGYLINKLEDLHRRHLRLVALVDGTYGNAGDDYITPEQRASIEAQIESVTAELAACENELAKEAHDNAPAAEHVDLPADIKGVDDTWSEQSVYAWLLGLRGEPTLEQADHIVAVVNKAPHLYLTTGQACRNYESLLVLLGIG